MSKHVRFCVHKHIAKEVFAKLRVLDEGQFEEVEWGMVWGALKEVPRMFQVWTSKQVMNVAGVNKKWQNTNHDTARSIQAVIEQ